MIFAMQCLAKRKKSNSQLQQGQVGVAVECPVLALEGHIVLEDGGGLGVVPIEAIEDCLNMGRPGLTLVEGDHFDIAGGRWEVMRVFCLCCSFWWDFPRFDCGRSRINLEGYFYPEFFRTIIHICKQ